MRTGTKLTLIGSISITVLSVYLFYAGAALGGYVDYFSFLSFLEHTYPPVASPYVFLEYDFVAFASAVVVFFAWMRYSVWLSCIITGSIGAFFIITLGYTLGSLSAVLSTASNGSVGSFNTIINFSGPLTLYEIFEVSMILIIVGIAGLVVSYLLKFNITVPYKILLPLCLVLLVGVAWYAQQHYVIFHFVDPNVPSKGTNYGKITAP